MGAGTKAVVAPTSFIDSFPRSCCCKAFLLLFRCRETERFSLLKTFCVSSSSFPCLENDFKINRRRFMFAHNSLTTIQTRARVWETTANVFLFVETTTSCWSVCGWRQPVLMWWITSNLLRHPGFYSLFRATTCQIRLSISCLMKARVDQQRCLLLFSSCM